jgi:hypothetical protein
MISTITAVGAQTQLRFSFAQDGNPNSPRRVYLPIVLQGANEHNHDGHNHNHMGLDWPPTPYSATNIVTISNLAEIALSSSRHAQKIDFLERIALTHTAAKNALGNKFTRIGIVEPNTKDSTQQTMLVYFSRDNNATVEVTLNDSEVASVRSISAIEYQPEITDEETTEAIDLARSHFQRQGVARVTTLKGYGILAYRPEGAGFYDKRVIYVSFHLHDDAPPEFVAWVNLSDQTIIQSREDK